MGGERVLRSQGLGDRLGDERGVAQRGEADPEDAGLVLRDEGEGSFQGKSGLAGTARAGERDEASAGLDPVVSDRLLRVARIIALACEVLENEERARGWLKRSQIGLGGRTPLSFLAADLGCAEVERLLLRIEHGIYT